MIRCGCCKDRHESVVDVRMCYDVRAHDDEMARLEQEAEKACERWYEERGCAVDDPRERELWALEDMRHGLA